MAGKLELLVRRWEENLNASRTAMERKTLNIKWRDHISNKTVKKKSKLPELLTTIMKQKVEMGWARGSHERQLGA